MLVTFKCRSAPDVVMLRNLAQYLLAFIGKEVGARGVISHEELDAALPMLERAIREEAHTEAALDALHHVPNDHGSHDDPEAVRHRAWPLLDMMRQAHCQGDDILWGL